MIIFLRLSIQAGCIVFGMSESVSSNPHKSAAYTLSIIGAQVSSPSTSFKMDDLDYFSRSNALIMKSISDQSLVLFIGARLKPAWLLLI